MFYIIDTSSLINLYKFFIFDKNSSEEQEQYKKFKEFFVKKFQKKEIIIIDKVKKEHIDYILKEFQIKDRLIEKTDHILDLLNKVANDKRNRNQNYKNKKVDRKNELKEADLYLVAYCIKLQSKYGKGNVCLITDENENQKNYTKLYNKIPNICKIHKIECGNLVYLIFDRFKEELIFDITIGKKEK